MARNKYPEETYNLIVTVATKLFIEKGYEKTSLNDIITNLGGLTKGAIYHHFKSKEDILIAVVNNICNGNDSAMIDIKNDKSLNGKQKLEKMFITSISDNRQESLFSFFPNMIDNPTFLSYYIKIIEKDTIPFVQGIVEEGIEDGSIHTDYPKQLVSILMFVSNLWLNPLVFKMDNEEIYKRASLANEMLKPFSISLFSEETIKLISKYNDLIK